MRKISKQVTANKLTELANLTKSNGTLNMQLARLIYYSLNKA